MTDLVMPTGKSKFTTAFPTFVGIREWVGTEELNRLLELEIMRVRTKDPEGIYRSNIAGCWHSGDNITKAIGPAGEMLNSMFFAAFSDLAGAQAPKRGEIKLSLQTWAMMMRDRGYSTTHTHPNCHFSGVYYVRTGPESPEKTMATGVAVHPGDIEFMDIRGGPNSQQVKGLTLQPSLRFTPRAGTMLVFPSWLPHFVHPVDGEGDRISVACNATVVKFEPKKEEPNVSNS